MNNFFSIAISGFLLLGMTAGCGRKETKQRGEKVIRVTAESLQKRTFRRLIPVQGTVVPVEHATISAKISGTLDLLKAGEGQALRKGDILFGIDRQILKNQLMVREAEIEVKRSELDSAGVKLESAGISGTKAKQDFERYSKLFESKVASSADFESYDAEYKKSQAEIKDAQAAVNNAAAQLKQAEANLVIARKNLADSALTAPFDCTVVKKYVEENEYVTAGQDILELENHSSLEAESYISSVYYNDIFAGVTPVELSVDGVEKGRCLITYKAPSIEPSSRTFKIKAVLPQGTDMVSGMLCDLNIILEEKQAYGLPADALLLRSGNRHIVYAVDKDGRARSMNAVRGIVDGGYCEVLNAPELINEKIVTSGQTFVNTGTLLRLIDVR